MNTERFILKLNIFLNQQARNYGYKAKLTKIAVLNSNVKKPYIVFTVDFNGLIIHKIYYTQEKNFAYININLFCEEDSVALIDEGESGVNSMFIYDDDNSTCVVNNNVRYSTESVEATAIFFIRAFPFYTFFEALITSNKIDLSTFSYSDTKLLN